MSWVLSALARPDKNRPSSMESEAKMHKSTERNKEYPVVVRPQVANESYPSLVRYGQNEKRPGTVRHEFGKRALEKY